MDQQVQTLDHHRLRLLLPWWVNESLRGHERIELEEHLQGCAECQNECRELERALNAVQASPSPIRPVSPALDSVMQRVDAAESFGHTSTPTRSKGPATWMPVAAAAAVLLGVFLVLRPSSVPLSGGGDYSVLEGGAAMDDVLLIDIEIVPARWSATSDKALISSFDNPALVVGVEVLGETRIQLQVDPLAPPEQLLSALERLQQLELVTRAELSPPR